MNKFTALMLVLLTSIGCGTSEEIPVKNVSSIQVPRISAESCDDKGKKDTKKVEHYSTPPARRVFYDCNDKTKEDYLALLKIDRLEKLSLFFRERGDLEPAVCGIIAQLPQLKSLEIHGSYVSRDCLNRLSAAKMLESLTLTGNQINDSTIALVMKLFPHLNELNPQMTDCTDEACRLMSRSGQIKKIDFGLHSRYIFDPGIKLISKMKQLTHLTINPKLTDKGVAYLEDLPNLKYLDLSYNSGITGKGVGFLNQLSHLEYLDLSYTQISDEAFASIGKIKSIKTLSLAKTLITDIGLSHLHDLSSLEVLILVDCRVNGSGFKNFSNLNQLRRINLNGSQFDISNAIYLAQLKALRDLEIGNLDVPPKKNHGRTEIGTLHMLTQLESLIWDTYDQSLLELHEKLPHVRLSDSELHMPQ